MKNTILITGLPKAGKSHLLKELVQLYHASEKDIHFKEISALKGSLALSVHLTQVADEMDLLRQEKVVGIIFVHNIEDGTILSNTQASLMAFKRFLGEDLKNLILLTNRWNVVDKKIGLARETAAERFYWNLYIAAGATVERYHTRNDLLRIINWITAKSKTKSLVESLVMSSMGGSSVKSTPTRNVPRLSAPASAPGPPSYSASVAEQQQVAEMERKIANMEAMLRDCWTRLDEDQVLKDSMRLELATQTKLLDEALDAQRTAEEQQKVFEKAKNASEVKVNLLRRVLEEEKVLAGTSEQDLDGLLNFVEREIITHEKFKVLTDGLFRRLDEAGLTAGLTEKMEEYRRQEKDRDTRVGEFRSRTETMMDRRIKLYEACKVAKEDLEAFEKELDAAARGKVELEGKASTVQELPSLSLSSTQSFVPARRYFPPPIRQSSGPQLRDGSLTSEHSQTSDETGPTVRNPQQHPAVQQPQLYPALQNPQVPFYLSPFPPPPAPQQYQQQLYLSSPQSQPSPDSSNSTILDSSTQALQQEIDWIEAQHNAELLQEEQEIARMEMEMKIQERKQNLERMKNEKMVQVHQARWRVQVGSIGSGFPSPP